VRQAPKTKIIGLKGIGRKPAITGYLPVEKLCQRTPRILACMHGTAWEGRSAMTCLPNPILPFTVMAFFTGLFGIKIYMLRYILDTYPGTAQLLSNKTA
jgi:hypothetical protein